MKNSQKNLIVKSARKGDAESFGRLYEYYYATMTWLAYSILLDRNLAEDAVQQTFVKACEKLANLRDVDRFGPWLARICRNEAHQLIRERKRIISYEQAEPEQAEVPDKYNDDQKIMVKTAIEQLKPIYREIIFMHYYSHMTYQQIACSLGITDHTVRSRLFRARKKIETHLKKNGYQKG